MILIPNSRFVSTCKNTNHLLSYQLYPLKKNMKNTEGVPRGRGLAAPESVYLLSISFS